MQKIANFIVRALAARGIQAYLFLDDLVVVLDPDAQREQKFATALYIIRDLGFPIVYEKIQPPSQYIKFLGINIDVIHRELSIPDVKINQFLQLIDQIRYKESIPKKQFQSLIGRINFFAKIGRPARLFMARSLHTFRSHYDDTVIPVGHNITADLKWFKKFLKAYNGRTMIPSDGP